MADLSLTAAKIGVVDPLKAEIFTFIAAETITAGQVVYLTSSGTVGVADGNGSGTVQAKGIALNGGGAGQAIDVLKRGRVYGFTITQAYDAVVYLSDTAGALADAAGSTTVPMGRVTCLPDKDKTKVLYIECRWAADWS
jgi:hypothetical protein